MASFRSGCRLFVWDGLRVKTDTVVLHTQIAGRSIPPRVNDDMAIGLISDSMPDGIFHQRLQRERGQEKILILQIVLYGDVRKPEMFDVQIIVKMGQLLREWHRGSLRDAVHINAQIFRKMIDGGTGIRRAAVTQIFNGVQGIKKKVRLNLADHQRYMTFGKFPLLFCDELTLFQLQREIENQYGKQNSDIPNVKSVNENIDSNGDTGT